MSTKTPTPPAPSPAPLPFRKLDPFETEERNQKILQWRYVHSWPPRVIANMLEREANEIRKAGGIPARPLKADRVLKIINESLSHKATEEELGIREARMTARMRYEHLFQQVLGMLRRQYRAAQTDPTTGRVIAPAVNPLEDRDAIAATRAAAVFQGMLDRVNGIDSQEAEEAPDGKAPNLLLIGRQLIDAMGSNEEGKAKVRNVLSTFSRTTAEKSAPAKRSRRR